MNNLKKIDEFLPEVRFQNKEVGDLFTGGVLYEKKGEGINLEGKKMNQVKVSDWMWDFDLMKNDFPASGNAYTPLLKEDDILSVFAAKVVNTFAKETWNNVKNGTIAATMLTSEERSTARSKMKGTWFSKKNLEDLKSEREAVADYFLKMDEFLSGGNLGIDLYKGSAHIDIQKQPGSSALKQAVSMLTTYFSEKSWKRAVSWLFKNIADDDDHVKWLSSNEYKPLSIKTGISPSPEDAFEGFVVDAGLVAPIPSMTSGLSAINYVCSIAIKKTLELREKAESSKTWSSVLLTTDLFYLFQSLVVIGMCAWVYDQLGMAKMIQMPDGSSGSAEAEKGQEKITDQEEAQDPDVRKDVYEGVDVYYIHYSSSTMASIISKLLSENQIGKSQYDSLMTQIESKKDIKFLVRQIRTQIIYWGNSNGYSKTKYPRLLKALRTDGSSRLIIPIKLYNALMEK